MPNKINTITEGNKILNILDDIDDQTGINQSIKQKRIEKNIYSFQLKEGIKKQELFKTLKKIVAFINDNYPKKVKHALKELFNYKKIRKGISYISENNGIISKFKLETLINLLLEKDKMFLPSTSSCLLCNTISEIPLEEIKIREKNKIFKLNKKFIKKAVRSKIIKDIYIKVCKEYANIESNSINIENVLEETIDKMNTKIDDKFSL